VRAVRAESNRLAALRPDFYIVWNTPGVEADPKIVLDAGRAAVNSMFAKLVGLDQAFSP
jgi:hypothetical protein